MLASALPPPPILETARLVLRPVANSDIAILHDLIFGNADVMRFLFRGAPMTPVESEAVIRMHFTFGPPTGYAVLADRVGQILGYAGIAPCDVLGEDDLEIGFVLGRAFWGQGYAKEIGEGQLAFGFETLGCRRLLGLAHAGNVASLATLSKIGMNYLTDVAPANRAPRRVMQISLEDWAKRAGSARQ